MNPESKLVLEEMQKMFTDQAAMIDKRFTEQ